MKNRFIYILMIVFCMNISVYAYDTDELSEKIAELNTLLSECKERGLECPYEEMKITVMEQFADGEDISEPEIAEARLNEIYQETKTALNQYISGEKNPMSAPKYLMSEREIRGKNMIANTTEGRRPVFFVGYGHFEDAAKAFGVFSKLGANITQQQIGPWNVVYEAAMPYGWKYYTRGYSKDSVRANFEPENVRGGAVSLKLNTVSDTVTSGWAGLSQNLILEPNTTYTLTFAAKASCGLFDLYVTPFTGVDRVYLTSSTAWKNYTKTFTTGDTSSGVISIDALENCEAYIDNIKLVKKGSTENLIKNGNFEENANRFGNNNEYIISTDYIQNTIIPMLEDAAKNNVAVNLLISPQYFPTFIKDYYPDISIYHEQYGIVLDKYIETLIPLIKDCPALYDICISNEPASNSSGIDGLQTDYREKLIEKYESIDGINNAWGTNYASVNNIVMPTEPGTTREFYDWMDYNDTKYAAWHKHIADEIRKYMPEVKIHSKMQDYLAQDGSLEFERGRMTWGTDAEKFAEFSDIAGNDAYSNYEWRIEYSSGRPISGKMKWYDFLASLYNAPVFNSEDHIISDNSTNYDEMIANHVFSDIFQGGIHGRSASAIWSWLRTADETSIYQGNLMQRPDVMASIGKASLDLNRLAYEVTAFSDKQAEAAIYYSNLERVYNPNHITVMDRAYDACLYAGQKVEFVTDNSISDISGCDMLIVPNVTHIPADTLQAIKNFKSRGKTVILLGDCFLYDEYGNAVSFDSGGYTKFGTANNYRFDGLSEKIYSSADNAYSLKLCDSDGNLVSGVEWNYTTYNGNFLINICNYNDTDVQNLKLVFENESMEVMDILSNENKGTTFTAKSFEPMIMTFDTDNHLEISDCYADNSTAYVTVSNLGEKASDMRIIAECYDKNSIKKMWSCIHREIGADSEAKAAFSFSPNSEKIAVKLTDRFGIILQEEWFNLVH